MPTLGVGTTNDGCLVTVVIFNTEEMDDLYAHAMCTMEMEGRLWVFAHSTTHQEAIDKIIEANPDATILWVER